MHVSRLALSLLIRPFGGQPVGAVINNVLAVAADAPRRAERHGPALAPAKVG